MDVAEVMAEVAEVAEVAEAMERCWCKVVHIVSQRLYKQTLAPLLTCRRCFRERMQ